MQWNHLITQSDYIKRGDTHTEIKINKTKGLTDFNILKIYMLKAKIQDKIFVSNVLRFCNIYYQHCRGWRKEEKMEVKWIHQSIYTLTGEVQIHDWLALTFTAAHWQTD